MEKITPKINFSIELANLFNLSGKVAYLPGGYGGIGESLAWGLAMHGASVVIGGRSAEKGQSLAGHLQAAGYEASALALNVTSVAEIRDSVDAVVDRYERLDILVNCVGIQREEPLLEVTEEAYDEVYTVNLKVIGHSPPLSTLFLI